MIARGLASKGGENQYFGREEISTCFPQNREEIST